MEQNDESKSKEFQDLEAKTPRLNKQKQKPSKQNALEQTEETYENHNQTNPEIKSEGLISTLLVAATFLLSDVTQLRAHDDDHDGDKPDIVRPEEHFKGKTYGQ